MKPIADTVRELQALVSDLDLDPNTNLCIESADPFLRPRLRFNRIKPHPGAQTLALCDNRRDVFFGGEGGSGKSRVLILAALQFADVPGYNALFLRKTFSDLVLPGAALDVAHELLDGMPGVEWKGSLNTFLFDTGTDVPGSLTFAHLNDPLAHEKYRGAELHTIIIDEITHVPEHQALFLFQRLRRPSDNEHSLPASRDGLTAANIPLRYRGAANPGGRYVDWVRDRYVMPATRNPASVHYRMTRDDNPSIDNTEYELSLDYLDEAERRRMKFGDWNAVEAGQMFNRTWFKLVADYPRGRNATLVRYWDCAATKHVGGNDPDWTVGLLGTYIDGVFYVIDVVRERVGAADVEKLIEHTAESDPHGTVCAWEEEGGSNGKLLSSHRRRRLAEKGIVSMPVPASGSGSKPVRARVVVPVAEAGNVHVVKARWTREFLGELHAFDGSGDGHDDQVDAFSGCFRVCARGGVTVMERSADRARREAARDEAARKAAAAATEPAAPTTTTAPVFVMEDADLAAAAQAGGANPPTAPARVAGRPRIPSV